jgi:hypothetical protein
MRYFDDQIVRLFQCTIETRVVVGLGFEQKFLLNP